ncbi:MAG TPA: hypothetical protein VFO67_18050 [Gemmatimonadales bacterium]|nr:hypothetical protein [Gemmatimonadales bacterium]
MRTTLLAVLAAVSLPALVYAQEEPKPETYLLMVAAAVSGYSAGGPVYVVICKTGDEYKVLGAYPNPAEAQAAATGAQSNRTKCAIEGPYYSNTSYTSNEMTAMGYGGGCKKGPDSDCIADSTAARSFIAPIGSIETVTLTYRMRDGRAVSETFDPRKVEAILFTMPAVDRMLIPYFVRVYGINGALQRRRVLLNRYGARDLNAPTAPR